MLTQQVSGLAYTHELVAAISAAIRSGELQPGDPVPSVRELAAASGLSPGSVQRAMTELTSRGLVVSAQGRRRTVAPRPLVALPLKPRVPAGLIDVATVDPDPELLPDLGGMLDRSLYSANLYDARQLCAELEGAVRPSLLADGVEGQLTATNGALDALQRVLEARLSPGDAVIVEDPSWPAQRGVLQAGRFEAVPVPIDHAGFLPDALEDALRRRRCGAIIHTPRGQNPTGAALSASRQAELREVLAQHPDVLVVEDDHLDRLLWHPFLSLADAGRPWAVIRSASKSIGPDLRLAVCASDDETARAVQLRQLTGPGWVSHIVQRLAARAYETGAASGLFQRAASSYVERRELLLAELSRRGVHAIGPSGYTVCVPVESEANTAIALAASGWSVQTGEGYRYSSAPFIRICVSRLSAAQITEAADAIASAVRPAHGGTLIR